MKKAVLVFSGFNPRAVIAFVRTLEKNQVHYGIIARSADDRILLTKYKDKVLATRGSTDLDVPDMLSILNAAQSKLPADKYMIAPSTEALNRFLLANQSAFESANCEIPLVSQELYEKISDKYSFGELCWQNNISVPREYETIDAASCPFVAKPRKYFTASGQTPAPILIFSDNDKNSFTNQNNASDFYYQEYIDGESHYLLYYFARSGGVIKFSQKNLDQQPGGKSILRAESSDFHLSEESDKYEQLFRALNFTGLVMVEVKQRQSKNYMIEANPRFWGPSQLFVDGGINLFEFFLQDNGFISDTPLVEIAAHTKYLWLGGYLPEQRLQIKPEWIAADVYNRKDTKEIFKLETGVET